MSDELKGMLLGVIGVAIFSVTLPATRIAVLGGLDAVFVGLGRAVVAAAVAAVILTATTGGAWWSSPSAWCWGSLFSPPSPW